MTYKYISTAETAKYVRTALKDAFPGIKFSVRSNSYSGGSSIDIRWTDGPTEGAVNPVCKQFQGSTFDGQYDSKTYHDTMFNGEKVHFAPDYVTPNRKLSRAFVTAVVTQYCKRTGLAMPKITGTEEEAYVDWHHAWNHSDIHWLSDLLRGTDGKDMHDIYGEHKAEEKTAAPKAKKSAPKQDADASASAIAAAKKAAKLAYDKAYAEELARQIKAEKDAAEKARQEAEQERKEAQARAEREKAWQEQQARKQREQEETARAEAKRRYDEQQKARLRSKVPFPTREAALSFLNLPTTTRDTSAIRQAFVAKAKAAADGKGGYKVDMDLLVKAKQIALG